MRHLFIPTNSDFRVIAEMMPVQTRTMLKLSDTRNVRRLRAAASIVTEALNKARRNS